MLLRDLIKFKKAIDLFQYSWENLFLIILLSPGFEDVSQLNICDLLCNLDYLVDVLLSLVEVNAKVFNVFEALLTEELL